MAVRSSRLPLCCACRDLWICSELARRASLMLFGFFFARLLALDSRLPDIAIERVKPVSLGVDERIRERMRQFDSGWWQLGTIKLRKENVPGPRRRRVRRCWNYEPLMKGHPSEMMRIMRRLASSVSIAATAWVSTSEIVEPFRLWTIVKGS